MSRRAHLRIARMALAAGTLATLALAAGRALGQERPDEPVEKPAGEPAPAKGGPDEEIVEVVDDDKAQAQAPSTARPATEPGGKPERTDKIELRGFVRTTLALGVSSQGAGPANATTQDRVGYERASSVNQAYMDVRYTRGRTFQAVLSGSLAYSAALVEGAAGDAPQGRDLRSVLVEPLLREAYIGFYSSRVDVRLGQQRIVWGNSDSVAPNDVLNARDTRNRMQLDPEMVAIPTLAARADFDLGIAVLGLVAQPFFVPDRASIYGSNWALVQPDAPLHVRRFFGTYAQGQDPEEIENGIARAKATNAFAGASIGASLRFHFGSVDASYYYHYGQDRSPYVYLDPNVANQLSTATSNQDYAAIFASQQKASSSYGGPLVIESIRRHHVGSDLATTAGPFVLRLDAAFDTAMTFYTRDNLNSIARPTGQLVAGVEYQQGLGKVFVLEATYMHLFEPEVPIVPTANKANDGALLFVQPNNYGLANAIQWRFFDTLVFEMRTFFGLQPLSWVVRPEVGYGTDNFTVRIGYLAIDGSAGSFGGYFRRNESVYLTTRYSF